MYTNKAFTEVMVEMVSREASYRQEVPCVFHLYGPNTYIHKIKEPVEALFVDI